MKYEIKYVSREGAVLESISCSSLRKIENIRSPLFAVKKLIFKYGKLIEASAVIGNLQKSEQICANLCKTGQSDSF